MPNLDEDLIESISSSLNDEKEVYDRVEETTKSQDTNRYYVLYRVNQQYATLRLSMTLSGTAQKNSLMLRGFNLLISEAGIIHKLVTSGLYFTAFREMRFLLEFAKRAAKLDHSMRSSSIDEKIRSYGHQQEHWSFRATPLLNYLTTNLPLTSAEHNSIDRLFGDLSAHAHGSSKELSEFRPGRRMFVPKYRRNLFLAAYRYNNSLTDTYLLFLQKLGMINTTVVRIAREDRALFPSSWRYLH